MKSHWQRVITVASLFLAANSFAATKLSYVDACTDSEHWLPEKDRFSAYLQSRIDYTRKNVKNGAPAAQSLLRAVSVRKKGAVDRNAAAAAYWAARGLFDLGLTFQAHQAFNEIIVSFKSEDTRPIRSAAVSCLARIHDKVPTLILEPESLSQVEALLADAKVPADEKIPFYDSVIWSLERAPTDAEAQRLLKDFKGNEFYEKLATATVAARTNDDETLVRQVKLLRDPLITRLSKSRRESWKVIFSMGLYDLRRYEAASYLFRRVSNTSNVFVSALGGEAWSYLLQHKYEEAIGSASNLVVGGLSKVFAPEGYETLSIALLETCNYSASLQTLQWFRRAYENSFRYLASLQAKGDSVDLYQLATKYLTAKTDVPDRVATDWLGDPVFLSNQAEINAQIDDETALKHLRHSVRELFADQKYKSQIPTWKKSWKSLELALTIPAQKIEARRNQLIQEIRTSLGERNRRMFDTLNKTAENLQLVEAETYEVIGDKLIAESGPGADGGKSKAIRKPGNNDKKHDRPTWDWGSYKAAEDGDGEVWEDELGALRANLKKTCDSQ